MGSLRARCKWLDPPRPHPGRRLPRIPLIKQRQSPCPQPCASYPAIDARPPTSNLKKESPAYIVPHPCTNSFESTVALCRHTGFELLLPMLELGHGGVDGILQGIHGVLRAHAVLLLSLRSLHAKHLSLGQMAAKLRKRASSGLPPAALSPQPWPLPWPRSSAPSSSPRLPGPGLPPRRHPAPSWTRTVPFSEGLGVSLQSEDFCRYA